MTTGSSAPKEGSLDAPTRHVLDWQNEDFYDMAAIEDEMERVFDICHGCRRCFNLCDSFPTLFDLIDEGETGEVDSLDKGKDYKQVADACTLCDMCFMTKCPYVPPHEFDLDFPHLILRYRAAEFKEKGVDFTTGQLAKMDRNGKMLGAIAPLANWGSSTSNQLSRMVLQGVAGIDKQVELPKFQSQTFSKDMKRDEGAPLQIAHEAETPRRKAVIYATCTGEYNHSATPKAAYEVLKANGVEVEIDYPACCGMPYLEHGNIAQVASQAEKVSAALKKWVDDGYDIITTTASCGLMMKFEWPLILPDNKDVIALSKAVQDISQYVVDISKNEGLKVEPKPIEGGVALHLACHARAQNVGAKSAEMLRLIPDTDVKTIERCSGHGGTFGVMKKTRPLAQKVAKNAVNQIARTEAGHLCSECPLACKHLGQELETKIGDDAPSTSQPHPIEIFATACGL